MDFKCLNGALFEPLLASKTKLNILLFLLDPLNGLLTSMARSYPCTKISKDCYFGTKLPELVTLLLHYRISSHTKGCVSPSLIIRLKIYKNISTAFDKYARRTITKLWLKYNLQKLCGINVLIFTEIDKLLSRFKNLP